MRISKRVFSCILSMVMLFSLLPTTAIAAELTAYPYGGWTLTDTSVIEENTVSRSEKSWKTISGTATAAELKFGELRYWVYLPEDFDASRAYPLVVYLHGSNVCYNQGTGYTPWFQTLNNRNYRVSDGLHEVLGDCIIFTPQAPGDAAAIASGTAWTKMVGSSWKTATEDTTGSTEYLKAAEKLMSGYIAGGISYSSDTYKVDKNRVYLIGDSMGAIGAYAMLADCPNVFAAAMVRSGIGDPSKVSLWKDTPIRIFHGDQDTNVLYAGSTKMIEALTAAGAKDAERITVVGGAHEIRDTMYRTFEDKEGGKFIAGETTAISETDKNVYLTWLSQQSKSGYVITNEADYDNLLAAVNTGDSAACEYIAQKLGRAEISQAECAKLEVSLGSDISITKASQGIGTKTTPFSGSFDGNYHTVTFNVTSTGASAEICTLFGYVAGAGRLLNVRLSGDISYEDSQAKLFASATSGDDVRYIAPLCSYIKGSGSITGVTSDVNITYTNDGASARTGYLLVTGLVGQCYVPVSNCEVSGDLTVTNTAISNIMVGGVLQQLGYKACRDLTHSGTISLTDGATTSSSVFQVGGIAPFANVSNAAVRCINSGNVNVVSVGSSDGIPRVGGLAGYISSTGTFTALDCENSGALTVTGNRAIALGGAIGTMSKTSSVTMEGFSGKGSMLGSTTAKTANSTVDIGGLIGLIDGTGTFAAKSIAITGNVTTELGTEVQPLSDKITYAYLGGLVGRVSAAAAVDFKDCYVGGTVKAATYSSLAAQQRTGGFVGGLSVAGIAASFDSCFFGGKVSVNTYGSVVRAASSHVVLNNAGTCEFTDCGHCSNSGAALPGGMVKFDPAKIPDEGMVAVDVPLNNNAWGGSELPEALRFIGEGVSISPEGKLCFAEAGEIEVSVNWNDSTIITKTIVVEECDHDFSAWKNTSVEQHSKTCAKCGLVIEEAHNYADGICDGCACREDGMHEHTFAEVWSSNDFTHFHSCTYPGCTEISGQTAHSYAENKCSICSRSVMLEDDTYVFTIGDADDYATLLAAVNDGDSTALVAVAKNIAGENYISGMTMSKERAAAVNVCQTADITLDAAAVGIGTQENPFAGDYDGQNHTVKINAELSGAEVHSVSLLGTATGTVENVKLDGSIIYHDSTLALAGKYIAPLAAEHSGNVIHCDSALSLTYENEGAAAAPTASLTISGLVGGAAQNSVTDCSVSGDITVTNSAANVLNVSGIMPRLCLVAQNLEHSGDITVTDTRAANVYAGGIATHADAKAADTAFDNLTNSGAIRVSATGRTASENFTLALAYVGGIAATNNSSLAWKFSNCSNSGEIVVSSGTEDGYYGSTQKNYTGYVGGIIGYDAKSILTVENCANSGAISYKHTAYGAKSSTFNIRIGGVMGCYNNTSGRTVTFKECDNSGSVTVEQAAGAYRSALTAVGGILGQSNAKAAASFDKVENSGNILSTRTMTSYLGGIGGDLEGTVKAETAENSGAIVSSDASYTMVYIGGFAGRMMASGTISNFTGTGNLSASVASSANASRIACAGGVIGGLVSSTDTADVSIGINELSAYIKAVSGKNEESDTRSYAGYAIGNLALRSKTEGGISISIPDDKMDQCISGCEPMVDGAVGRWSFPEEGATDVKLKFTKQADNNSEERGGTDGAQQEEQIAPVFVPACIFEDVDADDWSYKAICFVADKGIMRGVSETEFAPKATLSRAMIVTMLYRLSGSPAVSVSASFADVTEGSWNADAIAWAKQNGIVDGCGDGLFKPDAAVSREQFMTILFRYCKAMGERISGSQEIESTLFADVSDISSYAFDAMSWAVNSGLLVGSDNHLMPLGDVSREQAAQIIFRFCSK